MNFQLRYRRFWTCRSHWKAPLWFWLQLHSNGNDPLGMIRGAVAAQGKAWNYPHFQGFLASTHFCRAQVEQKYFQAHSWGTVPTRSLPFRGLTTWQAPWWARTGQRGFKTAATAAHVTQDGQFWIKWNISWKKGSVAKLFVLWRTKGEQGVQVNWQLCWMPLLRLPVVAQQVWIKSNSGLITLYVLCSYKSCQCEL